MKVRVVEDDPDIRELVVICLASEGIDVAEPRFDPAELLTPEAWNNVDAVLCDFVLGSLGRYADGTADMTGLDILRYLAGEFPHIRRVLITAFPMSSLPQQAKDFADVLLAKPSSCEDIIASLKESGHE